MASEWDGLIAGLNRVIREDKATRIALSSVLPIHKKRIFEQGSDDAGSKIGTYSTKSASIAKKNQARQTGHTYFKGGYSQYKSEIGKNPGFVNLRNTDQMQVDYGLMFLNGNSYGFGFSNSFNHDKSTWQQDKWGKDIFSLSVAEQNLLVDLIMKNLTI